MSVWPPTREPWFDNAGDWIAAYDTVQERLIEVVPGIRYLRAILSVMYGTDVHGVELYTLGSPLPEELWLS